MSNYLPIRSEREVKMQPVIRYATAVVVIPAIVGVWALNTLGQQEQVV
jgi:hypothetical protein